MQKTDEVRLRHMLDAAREAVALAQGQRRRDLETDRKLALALVKCIEIIGEAASKVSIATRAEHPSLPWADIVAMRNRLIHAYFDIDLDRVWDTVIDDLPPLVLQLQRVLESS
ncbi:MAG: DUF86 domain-containing protein [Planctomycetota bacterium]|jgi:uncharacterized protein with HEPN domain|nr:DUF86 domain-containing protein [Planctomycetota bacterium]